MRVALYLLISFMLFGTGCVEDIPLRIESPEKVVVNCILQNTNQQTLTLVYSKDMDGGLYYDPVKEAKVELFKNDTLIGEFKKEGSRTWQIAHYPKPGSRYTLKVYLDNGETIIASTKMPGNPTVVFKNSTAYKKKFTQYEQLQPQWVFALNAELDERWENPLEVPQINKSDKLIEHIATNHPRADRFNQYGHLGDVIGEASSLPAYEFYIRLNPEPDSAVFSIEAPFIPQCFVVFRNSSEDYDQYLKSSFQKMRFYSDEDDPAVWFDETEIYSNIENGVGIFGACYDSVFVFGNLEIP